MRNDMLLNVNDIRSIEQLDNINKLIRIESGNTSQDEERVIRIIHQENISNITLAAKACSLNDACMVIFASTENGEILLMADLLHLNFAREARINEVIRVLVTAFTAENKKIFFIDELLPLTNSEIAETAYKIINSFNKKPLSITNCVEYLRVLSPWLKSLPDKEKPIDEYLNRIKTGIMQTQH